MIGPCEKRRRDKRDELLSALPQDRADSWWTPQDTKTVLQDDLTVVEKAILTHRSPFAVANRITAYNAGWRPLPWMDENGDILPRDCTRCEGQFYPKTPMRKICDACLNRAAFCEQCGSEITWNWDRRGKKTPRFCSQPCRSKAQQKAGQGEIAVMSGSDILKAWLGHKPQDDWFFEIPSRHHMLVLAESLDVDDLHEARSVYAAYRSGGKYRGIKQCNSDVAQSVLHTRSFTTKAYYLADLWRVSVAAEARVNEYDLPVDQQQETNKLTRTVAEVFEVSHDEAVRIIDQYVAGRPELWLMTAVNAAAIEEHRTLGLHMPGNATP